MSTSRVLDFLADPSEVPVRRREGGVVLAVALTLLLPALGTFAWAVLNLPFRADYGAAMLQRTLVFLILPGSAGLLFGLRALQTIRGRTVVAQLEPDTLRVPANGTRNALFPQLRDGFRYAYRKRVLAVRVPYGRIVEVRRVVDDEEKKWLTVAHPHRTLRVRGLNGLDVSARGYAWYGAGAMQQAPMLIAAEFGRCWVRDPDRAVAITLRDVAQDGQPHPALPEVIQSVTLYLSVQEPDRLVSALSQRRYQARPAPTPHGLVGSLPALRDVRPP
jgi:hypothetical protein